MRKGILIMVLLFSGLLVAGQSKDELERRKQAAIEDIHKSRELLERMERSRKSSINRLTVLNSGIKSRQSLISLYEEEIEQLNESIISIQLQIDVLEKDIERGKKEIEKIVLAAYKNHTQEDKVMYLLASEDLNQFYQRIKHLKYLTEYRERKIKEIEELISRLDDEKEWLDQARAEKLSSIEQKEEETRALSREREQKQRMVNRLRQDEKRLREELREKERIKRELEAEIRRIIEEEARKTSKNSIYNTLTPEQKLVGSNFSQNRGRLPWPVDKGVVTASYGVIDHPVLKGVKINNNGIDISSAPGTEARAVFDGEVSKIFAILGANYTVIIMHGEYISVYQNLVDLKVKVGEKVLAKQEIGRVYNEEGSEVSVLHFQVWKERNILDPEQWISK